MISVYPTARRGSRERTSGQQRRQRSFPQICPGGTPDKYTIHPAGNTARKYHLTVIVFAKPIRSTIWISICVYNWSHLCLQNNEEASGAAEDGASEEEETEAEAGFIKRTAYASIPMQMHYHNTTSHTVSPVWSFLNHPALHSYFPLHIFSFYSWVCFWESVHSLMSLVIPLVTNVWVVFLSGSSLWNK